MLVSIIVPIYHGKEYISGIIKQCERCAEILSSGIRVELILFNDSPDDFLNGSLYTSNVIRVQIINSQINRGIHEARVSALSMAEGDYIVFLDQDDRIFPNYVRSQINAIREADAVVCRCLNEGKEFYNEIFRFESAITYDYMLNKGCPIISPGQVMIKRNSIPIPWTKNIMQSNCADDYFLWLCMVAENKTFAINQNVEFEHMADGFNISANYNCIMQSEMEMYSLLEKSRLFEKEKLKEIKQMLLNQQKERFDIADKFKKMFFLCNSILTLSYRGIHVLDWFKFKKVKYRHIAIYGASYIGEIIFRELKYAEELSVDYFVDQNADYLTKEIPVYQIDKLPFAPDIFVLAIVSGTDKVEKDIKERFSADIVSVRMILKDLECDWRK